MLFEVHKPTTIYNTRKSVFTIIKALQTFSFFLSECVKLQLDTQCCVRTALERDDFTSFSLAGILKLFPFEAHFCSKLLQDYRYAYKLNMI